MRRARPLAFDVWIEAEIGCPYSAQLDALAFAIYSDGMSNPASRRQFVWDRLLRARKLPKTIRDAFNAARVAIAWFAVSKVAP